MTDRATLAMVEQVVRLAKGIITVVERWIVEQKQTHPNRAD